MIDDDAIAARSYDAMLARGDQENQVFYTASVTADMSRDKPLTAAVERDQLRGIVDDVDVLQTAAYGSTATVHLEATLSDVEAGDHDAVREGLWKELEALGYEVDSLTVSTYDDEMER